MNINNKFKWNVISQSTQIHIENKRNELKTRDMVHKKNGYLLFNEHKTTKGVIERLSCKENKLTQRVHFIELNIILVIYLPCKWWKIHYNMKTKIVNQIILNTIFNTLILVLMGNYSKLVI